MSNPNQSRTADEVAYDTRVQAAQLAANTAEVVYSTSVEAAKLAAGTAAAGIFIAAQLAIAARKRFWDGEEVMRFTHER